MRPGSRIRPVVRGRRGVRHPAPGNQTVARRMALLAALKSSSGVKGLAT